jgi:hypothetical protein
MAPKTIKIDSTEYMTVADAQAMVKRQIKLKPATQSHAYEVGKLYHVETATKYYIGTLAAVTDTQIVLTNGAWVAHTGRPNAYFNGAAPTSLEPIPNPIILERGGIVMATEYSAKIEIVVR